MHLHIIQADDTLTHVALVGRLDLKGVGEIEQKFVFNTTTHRAPALVDLSGVEFIASLGIGMLVGAAKALKRKGAGLVLFGPPELVRTSLEMAGIHQVVPIVADEAEARALLAGT